MATLTNTKIKDTYKSLLKVSDNGNLEAGLQEITDGEGNASGVQLNTGGDLTASGTVAFGSLKDSGENITITKLVDEADGISSNDNDTTIPTSAAVKDYVDTKVTAEDLDFAGDSGTGAVDLDSQILTIEGTANEVVTSASGQTLTIGLPSTINVDVQGDLTGNVTATSVLANGVTATTQATSDNSTKVATTAYVDAAITAEDLDIAGDTGTGAVDLDSQTLTIAGTANEIETSASGQTITIGLPSTITANVTGNVSGNLTGTVLTAAQTNITSVGTLSSLAVSGNLTVDTNTLFVDAANNWVGIGTSSPSRPIHILAPTPGIKLEDTTGSDFGEIVSVDGDLYIRADEGATQADSSIRFQIDQSEKVRIDSSGNMGIGTAPDADAELHIYKNGDAARVRIEREFNPQLDLESLSGYIRVKDNSPRIRFEEADTTDENFEIRVNAGELIFDKIDDDFSSNRTERLRIDSSGNVGIGISSPATKVDIAKDDIVDGVTLRLTNTHNGSDWGVGSKLGVIDFYSSDSSSAGVKGSIELEQSSAGTTNPSETDFVFNNFFGGSLSEKMRIDARGNVGIGESTPSSLSSGATTLHIKGTVASKGGAIVLKSSDASVSSYLYPDATNGLTIATSTNHNMRFVTNATERMRISSSGNVGIGTSNADAKLEILGSSTSKPLIINASSAASDANRAISFEVDGSEYCRIIGGAGGSGGALDFYTGSANNPQQRMRIDSSGRVGIGTASPLSTIHSSAPKPTYTDFGVVFRGGTTNSNSFSGISLMSAGDALDGQIGSNYLVDGTTVSQTNSNRSSAYIQFNNTTAAGQTSAISFGGLVRGSTTKVERLRILSTGGLTFNGDTAAANALNDYEEGSFTPEVADATTGGNTATGTFNGYYTKIGNKVTVQISLSNIDTTGMTGANALFITNLPFTADLLSGLNLFQGAALLSYITESANTYNITSSVTDNTSYLRFAQSISGSLNDYLEVSQLQSGSSDIWTTVTYLV
jgi:hypothetical protein